LIAIAAFAGPAAGAAGRSQENLVLRPLLRRSPPGLQGTEKQQKTKQRWVENFVFKTKTEGRI
jgi:hypothetical protein